MRKPNYYKQVISLLQQLHSAYPKYNMGRHLSTALDGYGDFWGITDKEMVFALEKYKAELEMNICTKEDVDRIIKEGMDLDNILREEDGEDY